MENSAPAVGLVVPVFNTSPGYLDQCVSSALGQSVEIDLVLVDDASTTPETLESLKGWIARGVTVITHPTNLGVASALSTPYVLPVCSDDIVRPDYARAARDILDASPNVSIVASPLELFDGNTGIWQPRPVTSPRDLLYATCLPGMSVFRRSDWDAVGRYHEGLRWGEDWDLWLRIVHDHGEAVVLGEPLYRWRSHPSQLSLDPPTWFCK